MEFLRSDDSTLRNDLWKSLEKEGLQYGASDVVLLTRDVSKGNALKGPDINHENHKAIFKWYPLKLSH